MSVTQNTKRPLAAWLDVLDQIDKSLNRSLEAAHLPEPSPVTAPGPSPLTRLEERLAAWQSRMDTAQRRADAIDQRLGAERDAIADWLGKLGQIRQTLADWITSSAPK